MVKGNKSAEAGLMHRKTLEKAISFKNYVAIALGAMIGVGWIIYMGEWLGDGGPLGTMLAFMLGGVLLFPICKCYAELTPAIPVAFGYDWAADIVLFAGILGLITTLNGFYLASSRIVFALGRGGLLPGWFGDVHEKFHTPKNAIIFVGIISLIGPFLGKAALTPIVTSSALAFTVVLAVTCMSAIRLRKTAPELERPYKVNKKTLYLGLGISILLILLMIAPGSPGQLSTIEFSIIGIWLVYGLCASIWRRKKRDMTKEERDFQILGDYR
jgi:amino acid transporter